MVEHSRPSGPPPRRVALVLLVTALLVTTGLVAVIRGDQALLDYLESR